MWGWDNHDRGRATSETTCNACGQQGHSYKTHRRNQRYPTWPLSTRRKNKESTGAHRKGSKGENGIDSRS